LLGLIWDEVRYAQSNALPPGIAEHVGVGSICAEHAAIGADQRQADERILHDVFEEGSALAKWKTQRR
jgi:hypothetical protein